MKDMKFHPLLFMSPDLFPVDNVLDMLEKRLQLSRNTTGPVYKLRQIWQNLPQMDIGNLIGSLSHPIFIAAKGGFTTY